ncbi:D-2-hydroxyacid dehydrogenase [Amnibacterium flavum]|uniref:D-2-hydroxyacid dehydrogenase n=1 Tax=Amnibacterium flavum TaxID=2173173 RepID=A0A2V1HWM0_9MICO|nr:D-2-hydroxyacid dehydrogenase [Amnibacterium flavum]PVZ95560.1 D-2-hydroxyacid dehydrogenase [Amnibacterium flavum]
MTDNRTISTVLATVPFTEDELEQLRTAFAPAEFVWAASDDSELIAATLERADVAVLEGDLDDRHIAAPHLQWIHCDHSGLNKSARPEVFEKGLIVSGSAGRSAPALAQHGFYFALSLTYKARELLRDQAARTWRGIPDYFYRPALWGQTLGVVGFGATGQEMAKLGCAFGMRVVVLRRKGGDAPDYVDEMLATSEGDSVEDLIDRADVIMLATQLTDETHHLFGAAQFDRMKQSAILINISRGPVVDEAALVEALEQGKIAGAASDVFSAEPLPSDSALWDAPNFYLTPHMTPRMPDKTQRSIDIIVENARRYRAGEPLLNQLSEADAYRAGRAS